MFAFASGSSPAKAVRAPIFAVVTACLAGCAANSNTSYANAPAVAAYAARADGVQTEDDGLPSQTPPSMRIRQMPDDPNEPYSRNYGGPNPAAAKSAPNLGIGHANASKPVIPADLPPAFRRQLAAALDNAG